MQIERIDHSAAMSAVSGVKKQEPVEEIIIPAEDITPPAEETENQPGVLRLLQEGHFKGVADVRLRINFYEELQAIENQGRLEAAVTGFAAFNLSLQTDIDALKVSGELTDEQSEALDSFLEQIQTAQNNYDGTTPFSELIAGMQGQFDSLLGMLSPSVPQEPQESQQPQEPPLAEQIAVTKEIPQEPAQENPGEKTEEDILTDLASEEPSIFEQLVNNLRNRFEQALQQLESDMTVPGQLPPLSEPSGNGIAYAKFLAIYESMQNAETVALSGVDETHDTLARA